MAGLKTILGLFPKTIAFEEKRSKLQKEFDALQEFEQSEELVHFKKLKETVNSESFKIAKQEILNLRYKGSEEYTKEVELSRLKKSAEIKKYLKTSDSDILSVYNTVKDSDKLKKYFQLEEFIQSEDFLKVQHYYKLSSKKRFEQSDLGHTLNQYQQQSKKEEIIGYFKFVSHKLYANFEKIKDSKQLARYEELKTIVNSHEYTSKKDSMGKADFLASPEGAQLSEYNQLSKSKEIKNYLKLEQSHLKKYYDTLHNSDELTAYDDLEKFILSHDFKTQKSKITEKNFHDTPEYKQFRELETLKKDSEIKAYFKFSKSPELANYKQIVGSEKLKRMEELEAYVKTEAFLKTKTYLSLKPKVRWKNSKEFEQLKEYQLLEKSEKVKWYFAIHNHAKFNWIRKWKVTFSDNFDNGKLDKEKWLTRYYWAEEMFKESYSLSNEKHFISDGKNLDFSGSHLKIITKQEKAEGKRWSTEFGFVPAEFDYTSGLINSGKSFRQQYGLFEAKIKFAEMPKLLNAFWMVGDRQTPHINVAKANGKFSVGIETDSTAFKKAMSRSKFSSGYFVYGMEWTANKIIWRINGQEVASTTSNIPQEPMYIALSSGLYENVQLNGTPAMEVDWIKCYESVEKD
jgi:hypothetical protein